MVHKDVDRVSVALFYAPTIDALIGPITSPIAPLYKSIKFKDYLALYMNKELQGKDRINSLIL